MAVLLKRFNADREPPDEEALLPPAAAYPLVPEALANGTGVADRGTGAAMLVVASPVNGVLVDLAVVPGFEAAEAVELLVVDDGAWPTGLIGIAVERAVCALFPDAVGEPDAGRMVSFRWSVGGSLGTGVGAMICPF